MIIRPPPKLTNRSSLVKYAEVDLWAWLKELSVGILKISFKDNFQSFIVQDVSIPAGVELTITNQFIKTYPGEVPTGRIITRQKGEATIVDGDNKWTREHVFLKNPSANDVTISVLFFK